MAFNKRLLQIAIFFGGLLAHASEPTSVHGFKVKNIDDNEISLSEFKGKTLLIVNTASKCGYTPQYEALEALYAKYKARGLVVLGFPSNDFGGQEPGSNAEIKRFCKTQYKIEFPMFTKGPVKGPEQQPLFAFLTTHGPKTGEIKWNFEKFLVDAHGRVVGRFDSKVKPEDSALSAEIEKNLPR